MKIQPIIYNSNIYKNCGLSQKETGSMNSLKNNDCAAQKKLSNYYYMPVNFKSAKRTNETDKKKLAEKSGNFAISKFSDIPCPACGKKMLNNLKFNQIAEELQKLPSEEYLDCLMKYKEYMRPVEESVYDEIYAISQEKGASKDIRTLLVNLRDTKMPILQKTQMRQIKKMRALAKTLPQDEKEVLNKKIDSLQKIIYKKNAEAPFRRKVMIDRISKIKISNQKKYNKLQNIAKSFPASYDMNSAWIVKYSGKNKQNEDWNSYDIALRFLSSSIANTDHIIAYSIENNHNDISNYMSMHNSCNSQKSNKTFMQWLNEDKENRIKYMQDYFTCADETIKNKIEERGIKKKYKDYVKYAVQTVFEASKGQIKLFEEND